MGYWVQIIFLSFFSLSFFASPRAEAGSFGRAPRAPDQGSQPQPSPQPPAANPQPPAPPASRVPASDGAQFLNLSQEVGAVVDGQYSSYRELLEPRAAVSSHQADLCHQDLDNANRFMERVMYFVEQATGDRQPRIQSIASLYGLGSDPNKYEPVSLVRHPMCRVSSSTLNTTLDGKNLPSSAAIGLINEFVDRLNGYRAQYINGDEQGLREAMKLWGKLFGCLAYRESLTTADSKSSHNVAQKVAPSGFRKPAGVLFYEDPLQDAASKLNIGMYQFTPNSGGNVHSCIRGWNQLYPTCSIGEKATQAEMIRVLGSSYQTFNAFCGVDKVLQTFAVQVNTQKTSATHPANLQGGKLAYSQDRCVSLHFRAGKAYNHFGPFQHGPTMTSLFTCALK